MLRCISRLSDITSDDNEDEILKLFASGAKADASFSDFSQIQNIDPGFRKPGCTSFHCRKYSNGSYKNNNKKNKYSAMKAKKSGNTGQAKLMTGYDWFSHEWQKLYI